jgi:hypothetical protein
MECARNSTIFVISRIWKKTVRLSTVLADYFLRNSCLISINVTAIIAVKQTGEGRGHGKNGGCFKIAGRVKTVKPRTELRVHRDPPFSGWKLDAS